MSQGMASKYPKFRTLLDQYGEALAARINSEQGDATPELPPEEALAYASKMAEQEDRAQAAERQAAERLHGFIEGVLAAERAANAAMRAQVGGVKK